MRYTQMISWLGMMLGLVLLAGCGQRDAGLSETEEGSLVLGKLEQSATIQRTVALNNRTLVLDGFNGTVELVGTETNEARLTFTKHARGRDDQAAATVLDRITLEESGDEGAYRYEMSTRDADLSRVDVRGEVPRNASVRIELDNGTIRLSGLYGPLDVELESGEVAVAGAGQQVVVALRNGPIDVGFYRLEAGSTVDLRTTNGDLTMTLPASVQAQIEARTSAGDIRVEGLDVADRRLNPEGSGARFQGRLGQGEARITLRTENGTITLREGTVRQLPNGSPDAETEPPAADTLQTVPDQPAPGQPAPNQPDSVQLPIGGESPTSSSNAPDSTT